MLAHQSTLKEAPGIGCEVIVKGGGFADSKPKLRPHACGEPAKSYYVMGICEIEMRLCERHLKELAGQHPAWTFAQTWERRANGETF